MQYHIINKLQHEHFVKFSPQRERGMWNFFNRFTYHIIRFIESYESIIIF